VYACDVNQENRAVAIKKQATLHFNIQQLIFAAEDALSMGGLLGNFLNWIDQNLGGACRFFADCPTLDVMKNRRQFIRCASQQIGSGLDVFVLAQTEAFSVGPSEAAPAPVPSTEGGDLEMTESRPLTSISAKLNRKFYNKETAFKEVNDWLTDNEKKNQVSKPFHLQFAGGSEAEKTNEMEKGNQSRLMYARYEAVAVRYAIRKAGYVMPSAVVTAKGRYIYVVTFPEEDSTFESWKVDELEIEIEKFVGNMPIVVKDTALPQGSSHKLGYIQEFKDEFEEKKKSAYANFLEKANSGRPQEARKKPFTDGFVVVTGDFLNNRNDLGRSVTFFTPGDAKDRFSTSVEFGREDIFERKINGEDDLSREMSRRKSIKTILSEEGAPLESINVDPEKLRERIIEHVQMNFLEDMFKEDGGLSPEDIQIEMESSSSVDNGEEGRPRLSSVGGVVDEGFDTTDGLDGKDKIVFSHSWSFENEYDLFFTNWVSGWYLSTLNLTGHRYDAETALIFDFGSSEGKGILCSYVNGQVISTELLKFEQMLEYINGKNGCSPEGLKREILRQAQEVDASLLVVGTTSWHRTDDESEKAVYHFLDSLKKELEHTQLRFVYEEVSSASKSHELATKCDDVPEDCLASKVHEWETVGKPFDKARNPLKSVTTPLDNTDEGSYEAIAVEFAAKANNIEYLGAIMGAGGGSTQISAVDEGGILATCFNDLGSKAGAKMLDEGAKPLAESTLRNCVEQKLGPDFSAKVESWTMKSNDDKIDGQAATKFLKEHTKNKSVVGISAVFYSMGNTKSIEKNMMAGDQILYDEMVHDLNDKLEKLYKFTERDGKFLTAVREFPNVKKFLTEISNVKLQLTYMQLLYHKTSRFTLAREWKVNGKPFRTTWSTGWYINFLKYQQKFRTGKSTLVLKMHEKSTECFIRRPGDKIVQELPERAAKEAERMKSIGDYFRNDEEELFKSCVISICRSVAPDYIHAILDPCYYNTTKDGSSLPNLVKRKLGIFAQLNITTNLPELKVEGGE